MAHNETPTKGIVMKKNTTYKVGYFAGRAFAIAVPFAIGATIAVVSYKIGKYAGLAEGSEQFKKIVDEIIEDFVNVIESAEKN